jgi:predicted nucleic acid-binding protein
VIVLDASAAVELVTAGRAAAAVWDRILRDDETLHAPHLLDVEVTQALRRFHRAGDLDADRGREALEDLRALPVTRYPHEPLLLRLWELRASVSAYDAVYIALAEALDAPLVTLDSRLARAHGHTARIEVLRAGR